MRVELPEAEGVALEAVSRDGHVVFGSGHDEESHDGRFEGALAGGGAFLRLFTAHGQVEVQQR